MFNNIPAYDQVTPNEHPLHGTGPNIFWGVAAPDGDAYPWKSAVPGALYLRKVSTSDARIYIKVASASADADWMVFGSTAGGAGFVAVPLESLRETAAGAFINAAGNGGLLTSDTTPILNTINGDTDGAWRVSWAAGNADPIGFNVTLPLDFDPTQPLYVKFRAAMGGATNTPTLSLDSYFNEGDTKVTDTSGAVTGTAYATYTATIAAADIPADARAYSVDITPGAHAADTLLLTAVWLEYTRK